MQEIRVKVNQIELQMQDYEQDGDAIIFLHFSGANLMMWQRIVPYFQDRYRLILVDLRGHGKSDKPAAGYHMDEMAQDVIGIMQHLNLEQAHIVGSSLGAEVGLSIAANYPEKVISLVCDGALSNEYGPYGTWEGSEAEFEEHVADQLEKIRNTPGTIFPSVEARVDDRRELFEKYGWWNEYLEAMERYGTHKVGEGKFTKSFGKQAMESYMNHYFQYRFEDYYSKVKCPVLMLAEKDGEDERETAVMKGLSALAEKAKIVEVNGWAHPYCWFLNPEDASQAILKFLSHTA
ncbi:MAG: alpha/beta hydrolase [Chloroflexi bacterium]|nr:alpha/beta hydrolase [Chloroflexota bacterium]